MNARILEINTAQPNTLTMSPKKTKKNKKKENKEKILGHKNFYFSKPLESNLLENIFGFFESSSG
jgi:hypothetical protein